VYLRPIHPRDLDLLFTWLNDPEAIAPQDHFEFESFREMEGALREAETDDSSLAPRLLVVRRAGNRPIGVVGFFRSNRALETFDVWYVIAVRQERGKGYGSEAVSLLVDYLFAHRPVERVGATSDVENPSSYRTLERLGFRKEGVLKRALFHHGTWHDVAVYGITRKEWFQPSPSRDPVPARS
jgi:RimJ/RimL family protein N-acetyltransferase